MFCASATSIGMGYKSPPPRTYCTASGQRPRLETLTAPISPKKGFLQNFGVKGLVSLCCIQKAPQNRQGYDGTPSQSPLQQTSNPLFPIRYRRGKKSPLTAVAASFCELLLLLLLALLLLTRVSLSGGVSFGREANK